MSSGNHENEVEPEDWSEDYSPEPTLSRTVSPKEAGQRLDQMLCSVFPQISRARIQQWIAGSSVLVDGTTVKPSLRLKVGQHVDVAPAAPEPTSSWIAQKIPIDVVYADPDVIVINKPAGLVVHPGAGNFQSTLANALVYHFPELVHVARFGIVHRLDRDTSGLIAVARTVDAQLSLVRQLHERTVSRKYLALAWGRLSASVQVRTDIGRDPRNRKKMAVVPQGRGKPAITHFFPIKYGSLGGREVTLLKCILETGRTHQIRVHAEHLTYPLVGDVTYSRGAPRIALRSRPELGHDYALEGQALHAWALGFRHPKSEKFMLLEIRPNRVFERVVELSTGARIPWPVE